MNKKISKSSTESRFKELIINDKPRLIEVRADCCTPSYIIDKIIEKIENEYNNDIQIARIDYETHKSLFPDIKLNTFPTVLLLKGNRLVKSLNVTLSRSNLASLASELIDSQPQVNQKKIDSSKLIK
jgi:thioredoxin-like negative regulator of GroEL